MAGGGGAVAAPPLRPRGRRKSHVPTVDKADQPPSIRLRPTTRAGRRALNAARKLARRTKGRADKRALEAAAKVAAEHVQPRRKTKPDFVIRDVETTARVKLRQRLGKTQAGLLRDLPTLPGVQSLSIATRYIEGGRERFIEMVQLAVLNKNPHAQQWFMVYADLTPNERIRVSYDDVCAASGVMPSELMAAVVSNAMTFGVDVGNMVAALTHPQVVAAGARAAKETAGIEDRKMLFQHHGFIPSPKGTQISIHASANAQAAAAASKDPTVPSFADDLQGIRQHQPAIDVVPVRALPPTQPAETFEVDEDLAPALVGVGGGARDEDDFDVE